MYYLRIMSNTPVNGYLEGTLQGAAELLIEVLSWVSPDTFGRAVQLCNTVKTVAEKLKVEDPWETELPVCDKERSPQDPICPVAVSVLLVEAAGIEAAEGPFL